jgi:hypothetical protein
VRQVVPSIRRPRPGLEIHRGPINPPPFASTQPASVRTRRWSSAAGPDSRRRPSAFMTARRPREHGGKRPSAKSRAPM